MGRSLADGVYEHLITEELARALDETSATASVKAVEDSDAPTLLAAHIGAELKRLLASLPLEHRAERGRDFAAKLIAYVATLVDGQSADLLRDQQLPPPLRRLLGVHRGIEPERPSTPLSISTLLTRGPTEPALGRELSREIATADRIDAIVAFVTVGGVRAIYDSLQQFSRRDGAQFRLLTTTFTGTTEPAALDMIARLPGAHVKVSYDTRRTRLHAKAWLFYRNTGLSTAYIGSANLTSTALGAGHEWMVKVCAADLAHVVDRFAGTFNTLWEDKEFEAYCPEDSAHRQRLAFALSRETAGSSSSTFLVAIRPLPHQEEILDKLTFEREVQGRARNLVVAATGTGKTVIAALDYARLLARTGVPPRLLFLAHRKELLDQARVTFRHVLQDGAFGELLVSGEEPRHYEHVFASIQSVASAGLIDRFGPSHFKHVIVDECHHVPASSYQQVVPRLKPDILVGLTATPERSDGKPLLQDFDGHIACELRLWHALDDQLLVPFEYYGIADGVDLRQIRWSRTGYDTAALGDIYTGHTARADLIRAQLTRRVSDPRTIRALGFCVSVGHAEFMASVFTEAGIPAVAVHGASPPSLRDEVPRMLRERHVNIVFTCDLYNEGVDLPFVDTLLLLRPTQSATLFLQQLGRGLRHHPGKGSCLVLDFIGQHRDEFRFDAIFSSLTGIPRARLRRAIEDGLPYLPSGCAMQLDAVAREEVLRSLRVAIGGARRLAAELKELSRESGQAPTLREYLEQTGRDVEDIYDAGGWTTLKRNAGFLAGEDKDEDDLSRRIGLLLHIDEPERLRAYRDVLKTQIEGHPTEIDQRCRLRLHMLDFQLHHRGVLRAAEETVTYLASKPNVVSELDELRDVLEDRVGIAHQVFPIADWPLALHRHYGRREIAAAVGHVEPGDKAVSLQTGILGLPNQRELLFVTLDKSGKGFSPTTRYRDYAVSPELFHWETQAAASVTRPSGRRYLESRTNGWTFYLFVRTDPEAAFAFLGPVKYESHTGDRPIAITWRLLTPMPAGLYERYATLRPG